MSTLELIRKQFEAAKVDIEKDDVWLVQKTPVIKHRALERLANALRIEFEKPEILRSERDECVILVRGSIDKGTDILETAWSIGEACIGQNYKVSGNMAAYPYAMAEKRAKDRVILKIASLSGVYSEEEADDFRQSKQESVSPTVSPDGEVMASKEQLKELGEQLTRTGRDVFKMLKHYKAEALADLTSNNATSAIAMMKTLPDKAA